MNGVIGKSLLLCGLATVIYAITPALAWVGVLVAAVGVFFLVDFYRETISRQGLRSFIPKWMDDYLTREDVVEQLVHWIRDNGTLSKIARLTVIKFLDLSKEELVEVISGVWPEYRVLSQGGNQSVTLMEITPSWFRGMYLPAKKSLALPSSDMSSQESLAVVPEPTPLASTSNMVPLLLWLAEKRIRLTMDAGAPVAGRFMAKSIGFTAIFFLVWKKFPRTRKPLKFASILLLSLYLYSITRGLPGFTERIFKSINFTYYQTKASQAKRRQDRKSHTVPTGSFEKVIFALLEPLIPTVNVSDYYRPFPTTKPSQLPPSSPSWSQASTLEPLNISVHADD